MKFLVKERSEEVNQISELLKSFQKKVLNDITKSFKETDLKLQQQKDSFIT